MTVARFTCGLEVALSVMGGKWKPLILFHLSHATRRYGELRRLMGGVSDKMLIQHLKELCEDGLVERRDYQEIPPRVEYSMTRFGASLGTALAPLCQWGTRHEDEVGKLLRRRQRARGGRLLL